MRLISSHLMASAVAPSNRTVIGGIRFTVIAVSCWPPGFNFGSGDFDTQGLGTETRCADGRSYEPSDRP